MSFENTHLWAADAVKDQITNDALRELVNSSIDYYYFGAVFPDTLSYSHDKKIRDVSNFLHGETGIPPNGVVFDVLDMAKRVGGKKNLDGLMNEGINMGLKMIESAYDYYCGKISRQVCEKTIAGNNLDTGQIGKTKADVRFSIEV
jgi:hypothetical protein